MTFDRIAAQDLLSDLAWDLITYWQSNRTMGNGVPYTAIELPEPSAAPLIKLYDGTDRTSSSHGAITQKGVIEKAQKRVRALCDMVTDAAPVLDHPSAFWDIELMNLPDRIAPRGEPESPPFPRIVLSIAGISIALRDDRSSSLPLTPEETATRLSEICDTLSVIPTPGDRLFEIKDAHIPANTPDEALLIYDTMTQSGILKDLSNTCPPISEVFVPLDIHIDMRLRFGTRKEY